MRGLGGPSVQRGIHLQQTDGQASVEELTGGPQHSAAPAQHSCAPSSQSWCCGGIHGNGRFERPSRRSQTHPDPAGTIIRVNVHMNVPFFQQYTYSIMLYSFIHSFLATDLPSTAGPWAEDLPLLWQEGTAQQGALATGTAETFLSCVPVLPIIRHLTLVNTFGKMWKSQFYTMTYQKKVY